MNDKARDILLREYFQWHKANTKHGFGPNHEYNERRVRWYAAMRYVWAGAGAVFGFTVINPNFTMRRSKYMRIIAPALMASVGWQWGKKKWDDAITHTMLELNEYCPFEVRRCLATKDFRYLANWDYTKEGATQFCPTTGKSLT